MKDNILHIIIIVLVLGSTFLILNDKNSVNPYVQQQRDTISVSGNSDLDVSPDQGEVVVVVETEGNTAKEAQSLNAEISDRVIDAAKKYTDKKNIETVGYYLSKREGYNPKTGEPIFLGYMQTHSLKITATNVDETGDVLDAVVSAGATRVQDVYFSLSKSKKQEANDEALGLAVENARGKANSLAGALGVKVGDVVSVSERNYDYRPYYYAVAEKAMDAGTEVLPGDVNVALSVDVVFEIK